MSEINLGFDGSLRSDPVIQKSPVNGTSFVTVPVDDSPHSSISSDGHAANDKSSPPAGAVLSFHSVNYTVTVPKTCCRSFRKQILFDVKYVDILRHCCPSRRISLKKNYITLKFFFW